MEDDDLEELLLSDFQTAPKKKSVLIDQPVKELIDVPVKINVEDYDDDNETVKAIELNNKLKQLKLQIQDIKNNKGSQGGD